MQPDLNMPISTEGELDREMSAIIAQWLKGDMTQDQVDRYQALSLKRATLMNGGARLFQLGRGLAAA